MVLVAVEALGLECQLLYPFAAVMALACQLLEDPDHLFGEHLVGERDDSLVSDKDECTRRVCHSASMVRVRQGKNKELAHHWAVLLGYLAAA